MRCLKFSMLLLALSVCLQQVPAKSKHLAVPVPGFDFGPNDTICVMPAEAAEGVRLPLQDMDSVRGLAMEALDRRGYQARSDCPSQTPGIVPEAGPLRWLLTVRVESLTGMGQEGPHGEIVAFRPFGAVLDATLLDSQNNAVVWRHTAEARFGFFIGQLGGGAFDRFFHALPNRKIEGK